MKTLEKIVLPGDLESIVGTEEIDFSVSARRDEPFKNSFLSMLLGLFLFSFMSIFVMAFFGPIFNGEVTVFISNGVETTASWDNFKPLIIPAVFIGIFTLYTFWLFCLGVYSLFRKGGIFVATNNRLIKYYGGVVKSYDWEQFTGNMEINKSKGNIALTLRSGKIIRRKDGPDEFVGDVVYISGVDHVLEIEKICRNRIKENDPTPAV